MSTEPENPRSSGSVILGKTLSDLLYDACDRYTIAQFLNRKEGETWRPWSLEDFRDEAEATALGMVAHGIKPGDKAAFFLESDPFFCIIDMGCLLAGVVDVPIYLTSAPDIIQYILQHSEAELLFVSTGSQLKDITPQLAQASTLKTIVVVEDLTSVPKARLPAGITLLSLEALQQKGKEHRQQHPDAIAQLRGQRVPHQLATIIYTSGTTGLPKGVMLSHENISYNATAAISNLTGYRFGSEGEKGLSFLPLTHVFGRTIFYSFLFAGTPVYFTHPDHLREILPDVQPTAFATVPRVLEKVYGRIQERTRGLTGIKRRLGYWALGVAQDFELGRPLGLGKRIRLGVADRLVFNKWREPLGGRLRFVISGGAALSGTLANVFAAMNVPVIQGYGLTETSPVIAFNRPEHNRAGVVGEPMPGLEVRIADDGEVITRGPHVMLGYFKDEEKTREVIDSDGWFHTGDIGEFTDEGFLRITDRKKDLFKLSTGKYVMPQPLENRLVVESLIENVMVVGQGYKYCAALIFPEIDALKTYARRLGLDASLPLEALLKEPKIIARFQRMVDKANKGMNHWSMIKKFVLVPDHLTVPNGMLTPTLKVKRPEVRKRYAQEIASLFVEDETTLSTKDTERTSVSDSPA